MTFAAWRHLSKALGLISSKSFQKYKRVLATEESYMLYMVLCKDSPKSLQLRASTRPEHLNYLDSFKIRFAGPFMSETTEEMIGSLIILEANSLAEAKQFAANDPYNLAGLFESVEIKPFKQVIPGES